MNFSFLGRLRSVLIPLSNVRPGERRKTFLMFLYFFLTISLVYILKPVRSSLFIGEFGAEKLPFIYIGEGVWLVFVVWAYTRLAKRVSRRTLYVGVLIFIIFNLLVFWMFLGKQIAYMSAFFYVWVASFSIVMTTIFWTLANDIFNPAEAKRLFGIIMSGGSLGGILGGVITNQAVRIVGTENLLLVAAGILVGCIFLVLLLHREIQLVDKSRAPDEVPDAVAPKESTMKILTGSSYLMMLAAVVIIAKMSSTIVDAQFSKVVEITVLGKEERTAYFGAFWAWLNCISFFMQFFITSLSLRILGVGFSLWLLPGGLTFFAVLSLFNPLLATSQALRIFDGAANYSIQLASKETLYLPLPSRIRHRVKPIIDMLGFRSAKTLGGLYILAGTYFLRLSYERLGMLLLLIMPFWGWIAWNMKKAYSQRLKDYLLDRQKYDNAVEAYNAADVLSFLHSEKNFEQIRSFLSSRSPATRKLAAAAQYAYDKSSQDLERTRKIVDHLVAREPIPDMEGLPQEQEEKKDAELLSGLFVKEPEPSASGSLQSRIEQEAEKIILQAGEALRDPNLSAEAKRQAVRVLGYLPRQQTADLLLQSFGGTEDHGIRFIIMKALLRLCKKNPKITVSRFLVKNEIAREIAVHEQILKIRAFYRKHKEGLPLEDSLDITLRAIQDENVERVFKCLSLLYPEETIRMAHQEIRDQGPDASRSHAVELLSNTLEPDILLMVQAVLDQEPEVRIKDDEVRAILKNFIRSPYAWFSLLGHLLAVDLNLAGRWPELAEYQGTSENPLFSV
ncbi:MAG TPA: Npt1/Npt2 family nucleotide transporter [Verrucomicrobiae bacterium]|nr:Npt1/Npt2 family nucleotide transporter [Verrucomicrobiae bacterium]